jgi:hypothetical protein
MVIARADISRIHKYYPTLGSVDIIATAEILTHIRSVILRRATCSGLSPSVTTFLIRAFFERASPHLFHGAMRYPKWRRNDSDCGGDVNAASTLHLRILIDSAIIIISILHLKVHRKCVSTLEVLHVSLEEMWDRQNLMVCIAFAFSPPDLCDLDYHA